MNALVVLVADPGEDARREFKHGRLDAELRRRGGGFEPDQSAADDDNALRFLQRGCERARIRFGAQIVHARHAEGKQRQFAHLRSGGEHKGVIRITLSGGRDDGARCAIDASA